MNNDPLAPSLTGCVPIQDLHPLKDPTSAAFEGESFVKTSEGRVKRVALGAFPGCVTRLNPYIMISAARARLSDDLRHAVSPLSFFLSFFFGCAENLGIWEAAKDGRGASCGMGCVWRSLRIWTASARRCDVIGLQMRPLKDAAPELGHSHC